MGLFSYIVTHDTGFSPNPFWGYCTLACCKPAIRRTAKEGDWIVGLSPKSRQNRIVFLMRVDEIKGFDEYWNDRRFHCKKPGFNTDFASRCGDNIYEPNSRGGFRQIASLHSNEKCKTREDSKKKKLDLSGQNVLISENFAYFGGRAEELPLGLRSLMVKRGHRSRFTDDALSEFSCFAKTVRFGVHAAPNEWKACDGSWSRAAGAWLVQE